MSAAERTAIDWALSTPVAEGMSTNSASMAGTAQELPSSDMKPVKMRSGFSSLATAARILAQPSTSDPSASSSLTWIARSAPMPSDVRRAWVTRSAAS